MNYLSKIRYILAIVVIVGYIFLLGSLYSHANDALVLPDFEKAPYISTRESKEQVLISYPEYGPMPLILYENKTKLTSYGSSEGVGIFLDDFGNYKYAEWYFVGEQDDEGLIHTAKIHLFIWNLIEKKFMFEESTDILIID